MNRYRFYLVFGFFFILTVAAHFFRGTVDSLTFKAGNGELVFYLIPGTLGGEYYPESYLDFTVDYTNRPYSGMPFLGRSPGADVTAISYPMRVLGHFYFNSYNGPWPHKSIAVGVPIWLIPLLFLIALATRKPDAEPVGDGKPDPVTS